MKLWNKRRKGTIAGSPYKGATGLIEGRKIGFGKPYGKQRAHRIVLAMNGIEVPDGLEPDHKDGNPLNNRLDNLRVATHQKNCWNFGSRKKSNGLPTGVMKFSSTYFRAYIGLNGKQKWLGLFKTVEEAAEARRVAEIEIYGEFSRAHGDKPNVL